MLAALVTIAPVVAAPQVDQSQETNTTLLPASSVQDLAQSFTAGVTGTLTQVDVMVGRSECSPGPLTVEIYAVDASGFPTGSALAGGAVAESSVGTIRDFHPVALAPLIQVVAGEKYAIVLTVNSGQICAVIPSTVLGQYLWGVAESDVYAGGNALSRLAITNTWQPVTGDFAFRTYVEAAAATATPSPSVSGSASASAAASPSPSAAASASDESPSGSSAASATASGRAGAIPNTAITSGQTAVVGFAALVLLGSVLMLAAQRVRRSG